MKSPHGLAICLAALIWAFPATAQETIPVISLHEAIKAALEHSPAIASKAAQTEAMRAESSKVAALPNPELSIEVENIGGDGPYEGFDGAEITYGMSQLVELPGKRSGRSAIAAREEQKSLYEQHSARLDLIRDVLTAYASVVAAEKEFRLLQEERNLASNVYDNVAAKVDAGKEPPIQKNKARLQMSSSIIALERSERRLDVSKTALANIIGYKEDFVVSAETLPDMKKPLGISHYTAMLDSSPDILMHDAMIGAAQSGLSLEKSNTIPDPTFNIGVRDSKEDNDQSFIAGISFPLPVLDMNRAGIRRAGHEYNAAMLDKAQAKITTQTELMQSYENLSNAYREHQMLNDDVLPGAEEAFYVAQEGYNAGKFDYLDILDAQRTLFEARKQSIQTMLDYYRELAAIDRITALHAKNQKE